MDEVSLLPYVTHGLITLLSKSAPVLMPDASSPPNVSAIPVPLPTHPVAQRAVARETISFDWTPVPDAERYRLQIAATDAFETTYYDELVSEPGSVSLHDVLPEGATEASWRVRAENAADERWSRPARFQIRSSEETGATDFFVNASPVPIYPANGEAVERRAAAFTWEAVPEATGYHLQIGSTSALRDPEVDLTFDQLTSLTLFEMLPADASPLYWRVRALFPNDAEGPWSETARFGTDVGETQDPTSPPDSEVAPTEGTPRAAGPAETGRTSLAVAVTFILLLLASFIATLALIQYFE